MTPPPKCCGNCKWWKRFNNEAHYGYCNHPIPIAWALDTDDKYATDCYDFDGNGCPCHTPADRIERIEGKQ